MKKIGFIFLTLLSFAIIFTLNETHTSYLSLVEKKISDKLSDKVFDPDYKFSLKSINSPCLDRVVPIYGNSRKSTFTENSVESIEEAVRQKIDKISIDLIFLKNGIALGKNSYALSQNSSLKDYENLKGEVFPLQEFLRTYDKAFNLIIFKISHILTSKKNALQMIRNIRLSPKRHVILGSNCTLLKQIKIQNHLSSGCLNHGVLSNYVNGLDFWYVHHREINSLQASLFRKLELKLILEGFDSRHDVIQFCEKLKPSFSLVSFAY